MSQTVSQEFVELRKLKASDFRGGHALPEESVQLIADICDKYASGTDEERTEIRSLVTFEISFLLFMFSQKMAEQAVQHHSEAYLMQSIVALLVENCTFDSRDSTIALSKVFHSAQKIGMRGKEFFLSAANISGSAMSHQLRAFAARDEGDRNIDKFGFGEGKNAEGFFGYVPLLQQNSVRT